MELRDYIMAGAHKAETLTALARILGLRQQEVSDAKAHRRGLPMDACFKLADYIGADLREVIAANELATEKKEEKRQFWRPIVEHAKAASLALAFAGVNFFVTPGDAQASSNLASTLSERGNDLYYVKSWNPAPAGFQLFAEDWIPIA